MMKNRRKLLALVLVVVLVVAMASTAYAGCSHPSTRTESSYGSWQDDGWHFHQVYLGPDIFGIPQYDYVICSKYVADVTYTSKCNVCQATISSWGGTATRCDN